ncbi:MAG: LuxR C-terminal-related transcriptional regulator [Lautropia sp.]|nr:LuxR C-terminal-related transcriptional regulator [Lautropia sp.]
MTIPANDAAGLLAALGTDQFGDSLDQICRRFSCFEMSCAFAFNEARLPVLIHDGYSSQLSRQVLARYLQGGYLLDPFYAASVASTEAKLWRMGDLSPDQFHGSEFAGSTAIHPCISAQEGALVEEIGFLVPLEGGWSMTYSLMRDHRHKRFNDREFSSLDSLTALVAAACRQHWAGISAKFKAGGGVESVLQRAFGRALTPMQFEVVTMILRGYSGASIAASLGISAGTVKVHRHNAYHRLGISTQADLFALFLDELEKPTEAKPTSKPATDRLNALV